MAIVYTADASSAKPFSRRSVRKWPATGIEDAPQEVESYPARVLSTSIHVDWGPSSRLASSTLCGGTFFVVARQTATMANTKVLRDSVPLLVRVISFFVVAEVDGLLLA